MRIEDCKVGMDLYCNIGRDLIQRVKVIDVDKVTNMVKVEYVSKFQELKSPKQLFLIKIVDIAEANEPASVVHDVQKEGNMERFVYDFLDQTKRKFKRKNNEYKANNDELADIRLGSLLRYKKDGYGEMYETLKDYLGKHIAKVYDKDITCSTDDNWSDIALYSVIAIYIRNLWKREKGYKD